MPDTPTPQPQPASPLDGGAVAGSQPAAVIHLGRHPETGEVIRVDPPAATADFFGLPFAEARKRILEMPLDDARGMAVALLILNGALQKLTHPAPAQLERDHGFERDHRRARRAVEKAAEHWPELRGLSPENTIDRLRFLLLHAADASNTSAQLERDVDDDDWRYGCRCAISHLDYESGAPDAVKGALRALRDAYLAAMPLPDNVAPEHRAEVEAMSRAAHEQFLQDAKDAARYRWLRQQPDTSQCYSTGGVPWAVIIEHQHSAPTLVACSGERLDAAVDSAMSSTGKGQP